MASHRTQWPAALALCLPLALASLLPAPAARAQDAPVAEQIVDTMNKLFGTHPATRANHAKGQVVEGRFEPAAAAAKLSKAALFSSGTVPVIARFSDATGVPNIPDGDINARPNGLAVRFLLPGGAQVDMVTNTLPFFPVATGEQFLQLLQAVAATTPDSPKPSPIERFVAAHPSVAKATGALTTPASLASAQYNGVDAFVFVDAAGNRQPFRVRFVPADGIQSLPDADAAKQNPDFLWQELRARLAKKPIQFRVMAQLANSGDQTADPSQPWPEDRKLAELGTLTLTGIPADADKLARDNVFVPNNLVDGIEVSDDPLIDARAQSYAISFSRRTQ